MSADDQALVPAKPRFDRLRPAARPGEAPLSSIEKAAMILTAIGPDLGAGVLRNLAEPDLDRFARAVIRLGKVTQDVLDMVIVEFLELLTSGPEVSGGTEAARKLLAAVLGDERVERLLGNRGDARPVWERLNDAPPGPFAAFLQAEHPQTATLILSEIRPEAAAVALERMDQPAAKAIILRLSRVPNVDWRVLEAVKEAIDRDFLSVLQRNMSKRRPADLIAGLMNNISTEAREGFLAYLEAKEPVLAADVQRTMFTFEDISVRLNPRDVAGVVRDVPEEVLLNALKLGMMQNNPTSAFILENLPRRLSERYAEDLAALLDVNRKEGEMAQIEITKVILAQVKAGNIRLIDRDAAFG